MNEGIYRPLTDDERGKTVVAGCNQCKYKRAKGEWKQGFSHKYECSRCEQGTDIESDYCPWCGADMKNGTGDTDTNPITKLSRGTSQI